jgi:hypothetical protein
MNCRLMFFATICFLTLTVCSQSSMSLKLGYKFFERNNHGIATLSESMYTPHVNLSFSHEREGKVIGITAFHNIDLIKRTWVDGSDYKYYNNQKGLLLDLGRTLEIIPKHNIYGLLSIGYLWDKWRLESPEQLEEILSPRQSKNRITGAAFIGYQYNLNARTRLDTRIGYGYNILQIGISQQLK